MAATDDRAEITDYSRCGSQLDVVAPGGSRTSKQIFSTAPGGYYVERSGTSQAAAYVTSAVALALHAWSLQSPSVLAPPFVNVRDLLRDTAQDLGYLETSQGKGLLDVRRMMEVLQ